MSDHSKQIQTAIESLNKGDKQTARQILEDILMADPNNPQLEDGWYAYARAAENKEEAIYCLQKVLEFNPNNQRAKLELANLEGRSFSPTLESSPKSSKKISSSQFKIKGLSQQNTYILAGGAIVSLCLLLGVSIFIFYDFLKPPTSNNTPVVIVELSPSTTPEIPFTTPTYAERADCVCNQVTDYLLRTGMRYESLLSDVQEVDNAIKNGRESAIDYAAFSEKAKIIYKEHIADVPPPCLQSFHSKSNLFFWNWQQAMEFAGTQNYEATKIFLDGFTAQVLGLEVEARKIRDILRGCPLINENTDPIF